MKKIAINSQSFWVGGANSCLEIIQKKSRDIEKCLCTETFLSKNKLSNLKYELKNNREINKYFSPTFNHQGIALKVNKIKTYNIKELFLTSENMKNIIVLDGVTDQGNIGSIIRSCAAFGVDAVIIDKKNFNQKSFVCIKSASGAIENINIVETSNIKNDIKFLKKKNFWVYALSSNAKNYFHQENFNKKRVFIFGSEERGLKDNTLKLCDNTLKIEIEKKTESLNVSNAVSACLYGLRILDNL